MKNYELHFFVCENQRPEGHPRGCCAGKGSMQIREELKKRTLQYGLKDKVRINSAGCLDVCEHGAAIVVYPEGIWYGHVTPEDLDEIFESHIKNGIPVERLRLKRD